jgi:hypothetical protein
MADEQFTVYVSWTKDRYTNTEEVSAFGGVSSDESDDLFDDDYSSVEGYISITHASVNMFKGSGLYEATVLAKLWTSILGRDRGL